MPSKVIVATYDALGGPEKAFKAPDGFVAGPTDAGEYVIAYCAKHRSARYPQWSGIPWGSPLKEQAGEILVQLAGKWQRVVDVSGATKAEIEQYHRQLYGTAKVPSTWVFNDFGHLTCFMFKDKNRNRKLDPALGEKIHGEFFHTTPGDEAATALKKAVKLEPSHGCIHLKPVEMDQMVNRGYMKRGTRVVVHKYKERVVTFTKLGNGKPPYELHFYPGIGKLLVMGVSQP